MSYGCKHLGQVQKVLFAVCQCTGSPSALTIHVFLCSTALNGTWQSGFFDQGSFLEIMKPWAQTVVVGRARYGQDHRLEPGAEAAHVAKHNRALAMELLLGCWWGEPLWWGWGAAWRGTGLC